MFEQGLREDYAFLEQINFHNKDWLDFQHQNHTSNKRTTTNFLLHPKKLDSQSSLSENNTPRTIVKHTNSNANRKVLSVLTVSDKNNQKETKVIEEKRTKSASARVFSFNFDKKFTHLAEKSVKLLNNIRLMMEGDITPADGDEDQNRRIKRGQEFSARFSRVYLYPLIRLMNDLSVSDKIHPADLCQKIVNAHQVIYQGLQAYFHHLPSSVGKCCSDKLKSLLDHIIYLCQLQELFKKPENHSDSYEFTQAIRSHTELLQDAIKTFELKFIEKPQLVKPAIKPKDSKLKSRLSMYSVGSSFQRGSESKKNQAKKKAVSVKSRYKTASFKHRPPIEKLHLVSLPEKGLLFPKKSSYMCKVTPLKTLMREEDIQTMVELDGLKVPTNSEVLNHESSVADGLEVVRDWGEVGVVQSDLGEVQEKAEPNKKEYKAGRKNYKKPVVTICGAKNAKLICIRDDNSPIQEDLPENDSKLTLGTQTEFEARKKAKKIGKSTIKISRLPKTSRKMLEILPKDMAVNIIQYKLHCAKFHKDNPMYRRTTSVQPWILMGRISDDILNDVIKSVTEELEVNEILENLYKAEFQY